MTQRDATNILEEVINIIDETLIKEYYETAATLARRIDEIKPHVIKTGRDADMLQALLEDLKANHAGRDAICLLKTKIMGIQPYNRPSARFIKRCVDIAIKSYLQTESGKPAISTPLTLNFTTILPTVREAMVAYGYDAESVVIWNGLDRAILEAVKAHEDVVGASRIKDQTIIHFAKHSPAA